MARRSLRFRASPAPRQGGVVKGTLSPKRGWFVGNYFVTISVVILLLSIWGFSDNLFWDIGQPSNSDPKFIIHGLFCLAWMAVFVLQTMLVSSGKTSLHRRVGVAGFVIALGVIASTVYVFAAVWKGWANMEPFVKANRILFTSYAVSIIWAAYNRRKTEWHKRLMLVGTLFMLEPILSRVFGTAEVTVLRGMADHQLDLYWYVVVFSIWSALFLSLFVYDWLSAKRFHPVTLAAASWIVVVWMAVQFI